MAKWLEWKGNILDFEGDMIVNPVNCDGFMGRGLALDVRKRYPDLYLRHRSHCEQGLFTIGKLSIYRTETLQVLNFPTKNRWRDNAKLIHIEVGLRKLRDTYLHYGIKSICIPPIGCGLGGLNYDAVKSLIISYLDDTDLDIYLIAPNGRSSTYDTYKKKRV